MLYFICVVIGAFVFAAVYESFSGFLTGAFLGWLMGMTLKLRAHVERQDEQLQNLATQLKIALAEIAKPRAEKRPAETPESRMAPVRVEPTPLQAMDETAVPEQEPPYCEAPQAAQEALELDVERYDLTPAAKPEPAPERKQEPDLNPWLSAEAAAPAPPKPASESPRRIREPAEPGAVEAFIDRAQQWVVAYFTGGNLMVRVGILILFFGVAFLLKYAAQTVVVPVELRYVGVMAAATVLLILGWRLRGKNEQYALVLQGGAVGVLYLVVFAAFRLHALLGSTLAFSLMLAIVVLTALIAILQNAPWLAAVGVTGGFAAPILTSTGSGSHVELFSFYLILNLGIAFIAFYRSWRLLNWLGFVFTFGIGTLWGAQYYQAEFFSSTEPFLVGFFLLYTLIPLLYALKQPPELKGLVDGTLIFGTPVAFMGLQSQMLEGYTGIPHLLAWSSVALGALYILLALFTRRRSGLTLLCESYIALAIAFLTLAIPLGLDGRVTSAIWAVEGAALIWVGLRQHRLLPRLSGLGLIFVAAFFFVDEPAALGPTTFVFNSDFLGAVLLSAAALHAARLYRRFEDALTLPERQYGFFALLVWGYGWWLGGGLNEIDRHFTGLTELVTTQAFLGATAVMCWLMAQRDRTLPIALLGLFSVAVSLAFLWTGYDFDFRQPMWTNLNIASAVLVAGLCLWMAIFAWQHRFSEFLGFAEATQVGLMWIGTGILLAFGYSEIAVHAEADYRTGYSLLCALAILLPFMALHRKFPWPELTQPLLLVLPILAVALAFYVERDVHLVSYYGWAIFPLAIVGLYLSLKYLEQVPQYPLGYFHLASILILTFALAWQFGKLFKPTRIDQTSLWVISVWGITFSLVLVALHKLRDLEWPFRRHEHELNALLPRILLVLLGGWMLISNLRDPGNTGPIFYLPLLNPLDLANLAAVALIFLWLHRYDPDILKDRPQLAYAIPGALAFFWINAALLRAFHFMLDIPFRFDAMVRSFAVESGISILWSSIGLVVMILATRRGWRSLWILGGILMGAVVVKLFAVDLSGTGTIARIVAFITVGILLLIVGYFAPVPPKAGSSASREEEASAP